MPDTPWYNLLPQAPAPVQQTTPQQQVSMQEMRMRMQEMGQQQQEHNALKNFFSQPGHLNEQTGLPTPKAMSDIFRVSPETGMKLMQSMGLQQQRQQQMNFQQSKMGVEVSSQIDAAQQAGYAAQEQASNKMPADQAAKIGEQTYYERINQLVASGALPPNFKIPPYNSVAAQAAALPSGDAAKFKEETDYTQDGPIKYRVYGSGKTTTLRGDPYTPTGRGEIKPSEMRPVKMETVDGKPVDVIRGADGRLHDFVSNEPIDPKTLKTGSVHTESSSAQATAEQDRALAEEIYSYRQAPLTSYALARRPGLSKALEDIGKEQGKPYDAKQFYPAKNLLLDYSRNTPNSAGGKMNAINTATQHLEQLRGLYAALNNKDIPAANYVINYVKTQLGHPEVTNVDAAAGIIADEVVKSVVGSGAVFDRERMTRQLGNTKSPEQMAGAIDTITGLQGGAANTLLKQWTALHQDPEEWESKLTPEARVALDPYLKEKHRGDAAKPPVPSTAPTGAGGMRQFTNPADAQALEPGTHYLRPDGKGGWVEMVR